MNTIKRLQRLTGEQTSQQKPSARTAEISDLRRRIDAIMSRRQTTAFSPPPKWHGSPMTLKEMVEGEECNNSCGTFFIAQGFLKASSHHGRRRIGEISGIDMNAVSLLANTSELASFKHTDALFLDTETTGLAGGTGTLAFLIGLGWFENELFVTQQLFARDFSEERASLSFLLELARGKKFIVTFNGKAFDVGLLSSRFVLNRLPDLLTGMPHLDLLHPSRRLLAHRLDNNRLSTIEKEILGFCRDGDIPGSEIPQRYFGWLRNRDARLMADVFEHNRLDVVSLALIAVHLSEMLKFKCKNTATDHFDLLAVTKLLLDRGELSGARTILVALINAENDHAAFEARRTLSLLYKRSGSWNDAIRIWEMMLADDPGNFFAAEELAKWFEHKQHNLKKAIHIVSKALECSHSKDSAERNALVHRLLRLQKRTD